MTTHKTFSCNFCGKPIDNSHSKRMGFAFEWNDANKISLSQHLWTCDRHICDQCLRDFRDESVGVQANNLRKVNTSTEQPANEATGDLKK